MAVNGVRGAGGHDICPPGACACGHPPLAPELRATAGAREERGAPALRLHAFWECAVARAVLAALVATLAAAGVHPPSLLVAHLWLCVPPAPALDPTVWRLVCMAALSAMDYGRRFMWALHFQAQESAQLPAPEQVLRQLTLFEAWGVEAPGPPLGNVPDPPTPVERACRAAVADFWSRLQSFATLHATYAQMLPALSATHPFLARRDGRLVLQRGAPV